MFERYQDAMEKAAAKEVEADEAEEMENGRKRERKEDGE